MGKLPKVWYYHLILLLLAIKGTSRPLSYTSSSGLISDGNDDRVESNQTSIDLLLKGGVDYYVPSSSEEEEEEKCEQIYGFLPCSYSATGHLFLIVVYEYLLFHGESYVASGGERIFKILGPGIFGASAFQVIGSLPEALILLASGLLNSKETAQEYVYTGVGLLAGSTILLLTVLWGTCVIVASTNFSNDQNSDPSVNSSPGHNPFWRFLSFLTDYGITADVETSYMARIMLISVIPFIIIQIPTVFHFSSSGERILIIITLVISVSFLLWYFLYQVFQPWIQKRRLEFVKHEHLVLDILRHVQKHAPGRLLTADGAPNVTAIRRLFEKVDQDEDKSLSLTELRTLFHGIKYERWHARKDRAVDEVMKEFDTSGDKKITMDEFVSGFTKWLEEMKLSAEKQYHSVKSLKELYEILQPLIQKKKKEHEELISEVLGHVQSSNIGSLYMENGRPNIPIIRRLFEGIDLDKDNCISQSELRQLVGDIKFRNVPLDSDEVVDKLMEELDTSGDQMIDEEEFVTGVSKWLHTSKNQAPTPTSTEAPNETYQKKWEETDLLLEEKTADRSLWAWMKAIMLLVAGIAILAVLAEPLIESVQSFSQSATLPSFFISFILVPLATNARGAISAITAARRKKPRTTSLTFSEDCIGAMDGTHVFCKPNPKDAKKFFGRKGGHTMNVIAVCDFDLCFTFASPGWEGAMHDYLIFKECVHGKGKDTFPHPPEGKYYLVDGGYPNAKGYMAPYKGHTYHLEDFRRRMRRGMGDYKYFNRWHSSLRSVIERTFGVWKNRWRMMKIPTNYKLPLHKKYVMASMGLHNFIIRNSPDDEELQHALRDDENYNNNDIPDYHPRFAAMEAVEDALFPLHANDSNMGEVRDEIMTNMKLDRRRRART